MDVNLPAPISRGNIPSRSCAKTNLRDLESVFVTYCSGEKLRLKIQYVYIFRFVSYLIKPFFNKLVVQYIRLLTERENHLISSWRPNMGPYLCNRKRETISYHLEGHESMCKAKRVVNIHYFKQLYYTFIYPYLIYCIEVWGNTKKTYLD